MKKPMIGIVVGVFIAGSAFIGCSSSVEEAQMMQLNQLKEEYAALQRDASSKEKQKGTLEKDIAEKKAQLKKCNDDQQIVKQKLAK